MARQIPCEGDDTAYILFLEDSLRQSSQQSTYIGISSAQRTATESVIRTRSLKYLVATPVKIKLQGKPKPMTVAHNPPRNILISSDTYAKIVAMPRLSRSPHTFQKVPLTQK
ncbi:hypothetical protein N7520_001653 [Penicillium odoratum]|uniref:uncharacterized protein n=1 Tax=Penicillium odoratum TaxID=1167516 RepID=UPI00254713B0|nr:uncharacterized protein N7520_001653 [Penicillium odoratum]KAJ5778407.1 hypothetical protein N7520_001653 [Penicillium odoratum]